MKRTILATGIVATALVAAAGADTVNLGAKIRDFSPTTHPDFEYTISDDRGMVTDTIGADRTPVYAHPGGSTVTTHGQAQFDQWYHDVDGINMSKNISLTLDNGQAGPGGVYKYDNQNFFPIDNELLGNEDRNHNFHFTMEMHAMFTAQPGLNFSFVGDDDVWVYINGKLVVDLGGVHGAEAAAVNIDSLGLTNGQDYAFDLFFAERHTTQSTFHMETTLQLVPAPMTAAVPLVGIGILGRRRRMK